MLSRFLVKGMILVVICLLIVVYLYYQTHSVVVKRYTVVVPDLPKEFEGFTILHISDLHSKYFGDKQRELLQLIAQEQFDMVALTGDLVNRHNPQMLPGLDLIKGLKARGLPQDDKAERKVENQRENAVGEKVRNEVAKAGSKKASKEVPKEVPIFFVPGNHERFTGFQMRDALLAEGVQILNNSAFRLTRNGYHIWIVGVDDPYVGFARLDQAMAPIEVAAEADTAPKILLAHAPKIFPEALAAKINLVLVGHTHGGQIRLPFIGALVAPGQGLFPKYDYGEFTEEGTAMLITGGLGESTLPIRINNRPEIVLVKLMSPPEH